MRGEESLYPADWIRVAERDWARVERLLAVQDPDLAGFSLQQAVEKFLKAFLLSRGWRLRRIHDLEALLNEALVYDPSLEQFRAPCQMITGFYLAERYPILTETGLTEDRVRESLQQVRNLVRRLQSETSGR
jgi:HEPN domain-containing protein